MGSDDADTSADADAGTEGLVTIVDRVTLPRAEAQGWIDRLHRDYQPNAEARGLHLSGIWETRASVPRAVEIVVVWTLPGVRAFFANRAHGADPAVTSWWQATDAIALHRERKVLNALETP